MTQLTTTTERRALLDPNSIAPQWLKFSLDALTADWPPRLPSHAALTEAQRAHTVARLSRLGQQLEPASVDQIGAFVVSLQDQFGTPDMDRAALKRRQEGYLIALDGVPAFALDEAYRRILQREVPQFDPRYMPKGPELRELMNEITRKARYHAVRLRHLLDAQVEAPVQRAKAEEAEKLVQRATAGLTPPLNRHPKNPANVNHADKSSFKFA